MRRLRPDAAAHMARAVVPTGPHANLDDQLGYHSAIKSVSFVCPNLMNE
jgi:hypothetical protein